MQPTLTSYILQMTADLYRSSNAGQSWSQFYQLSCGGTNFYRDNSSKCECHLCIVRIGNFISIFRRRNFFTQPGVPGVSLYGYYDCVLAASQVDENTVYCGGVTIVKSTDGGVNWQAACNAGGAKLCSCR